MRHNYIRITKIKRKQKQFSAPRSDIGDHVILTLRSKDDALDFLCGNYFNGPCSIGFESQMQNLWCFIMVLEWNIMVIFDSLQNRKDFGLLIRKGSSVVFGYRKIE